MAEYSSINSISVLLYHEYQRALAYLQTRANKISKGRQISVNKSIQQQLQYWYRSGTDVLTHHVTRY